MPGKWTVKIRTVREGGSKTPLGRRYLKLTLAEREMVCSILRFQYRDDNTPRYPNLDPVTLPFVNYSDVIGGLTSLALFERLHIEDIPIQFKGAMNALFKLNKWRWFQLRFRRMPAPSLDGDTRTFTFSL